MTEKQVQAERNWYAWRCKLRHPDDWEVCMSLDTTHYSVEGMRHAAAEVAYYHEKGRLPRWAYVIERVDEIGDSLLFVYRDPQAVQ